MARTLADVVNPAETAVVTMEMQRAVIGDLGALPELLDAAGEVALVAHAAEVCRSARAAGVRVVHCVARSRPDRAGSVENCRLLAATRRIMGDRLDEGSPGAEIVPELELSPSDMVVPRFHGLTPFTGTALDQTLRNLGIRTVVALGCSLNVGVTGLVLSAVDLGYEVVVVEDAVVGVPVEYGHQVMTNTIELLATAVSTADLVGCWADSGD